MIATVWAWEEWKTTEDRENFFEGDRLFYILIVVVVTWMCVFAKSHRTGLQQQQILLYVNYITFLKVPSTVLKLVLIQINHLR